MQRGALEHERDIEELRRIAIALNDSNAQLIEQLRKKCRELEFIKGSKNELQQTLALIESLTPGLSPATAVQAETAEPATEPAPKPRKAPERTGPTPQPRLPVVERLYTLDEADTPCPSCGETLRPMNGQFEESEMIDVVETEYRVVHVQRQKYACRCGSCVETALGPERAAPGSRYSLAVAVKVATDKYAHQLPLARQVGIAAERGLDITTQTLWDLVYQLGTRLAPTADALLKAALAQPVIGLDQTSWPRLDVAGQKPWQMWAVTSLAPNAPAMAVHRIRDDKSAATFIDLLGDYRGTVVCDAASTHLAGAKATPNLQLAGCWAHVIRKFREAADDHPVAADAVQMIRRLYAIDNGALDAIDRGRRRATESRAVCEQLKQWCFDHVGPTALSIHAAVQYTINHWDRLTVFLDDAAIPLDNNATERAFRRPVIGRNNYFGAKSRSGTQVAATFFSLLETCRLHNKNFADYLIAASQAASSGNILLPWQFQPQ